MSRFIAAVASAEIMRRTHNPGSPKMSDQIINSMAGDILRMNAEIERLTAALATARNDALEEAAKSALDVRGCAKNLLAVIAAEVSIHSKTPAFRQAVSDMRDALKGDV